MSMKRRSFVKNTLAGAALVAGSSLLPQVAFARNDVAFDAKDVDSALKAAMGDGAITESADVNIKAPDIAENGAVVPVQVKTDMEHVESIAIIAAKNGTPLVAKFDFAANGVGYVSTRIKMGKTSDIVAIVKAGGKLYSAKKEVKVTIGGCGG